MTDHAAGCANNPRGNHVSRTEIAWLVRSLARPCSDTGSFSALLTLVDAWPDCKVLALAQHIDPSSEPRTGLWRERQLSGSFRLASVYAMNSCCFSRLCFAPATETWVNRSPQTKGRSSARSPGSQDAARWNVTGHSGGYKCRGMGKT